MRFVSYNIHKGFTAGNRKNVLEQIKTSIREVGADLVLLQEVLGHTETYGPQFEYLADTLWPHFAYGKNAVYTGGHHGNAILSRYPISFWENQDVSPSRLERRGLLHATVEIPGSRHPLHVICAHLALFESDRKSQLFSLVERIARMVPPDAPLVVGGDFNDWRENASPILKKELTLEEAFLAHQGSHARTFPSWLPALRLDRLYFRGLECSAARLAEGRIWRSLSDHLPVMADFEMRPE